jgi:hypothetical protein
MTGAISVGDFCRYAVEIEEGRPISDPVRLGAIFRDYVGLERTPGIRKTIELVRLLGIDVKAAGYLDTGGVNMTANGTWHIHYAVKDKPATQKFDILHELFEVIHKTFTSGYPIFSLLKEPQLSQHADRFAASVLIPPHFFSEQASVSGCDLVKLGEDLELSHQCVLIALGQHFADIPFVGALWEYQRPGDTQSSPQIGDFIATVVVKTGRARRLKDLCWLQTVPVRKSHAQVCSLVCAGLTSGRSVLWRSSHIEDAPAVLIRPLLSAGGNPYRVVLMAVPNEEYAVISPQVETIEPVAVNGDSSCPAMKTCPNSGSCLWKSTGGYYE